MDAIQLYISFYSSLNLGFLPNNILSKNPINSHFLIHLEIPLTHLLDSTLIFYIIIIPIYTFLFSNYIPYLDTIYSTRIYINLFTYNTLYALFSESQHNLYIPIII